MATTTNIQPLSDFILVRLQKEEAEIKESGFVVKGGLKSLPQGEVLAVGPGTVLEGSLIMGKDGQGNVLSRLIPSVKQGDLVLVQSNSLAYAAKFTEDGNDYVLLRESDVMAILAPTQMKPEAEAPSVADSAQVV